jgi:hypothetical protein
MVWLRVEVVRNPTSSGLQPPRRNWADSPFGQAAIGTEFDPVDNATNHSIITGDLAGDVISNRNRGK